MNPSGRAWTDWVVVDEEVDHPVGDAVVLAAAPAVEGAETPSRVGGAGLAKEAEPGVEERVADGVGDVGGRVVAAGRDESPVDGRVEVRLEDRNGPQG